MSTFLIAIALSFGVVFIAELGDKSQLMALSFATRYRFPSVLVGVTVASAAVQALSVAVGRGLGAILPTDWIAVAAGIAFLIFALWTIYTGSRPSDEQRLPEPPRRHRAVATVTIAFVLAELGDKTMLATMAMATQYHPVGIWLGSTLGMVAGALLAVAVGHQIGARLPDRVVAVGAASLFAVVGVWVLVESIPRVIA